MSLPAGLARPTVRKQMPPWELAMGFGVLVLGLAFLSRTFEGVLRFALLVGWIAGSGIVLALKTNFACPR